MYCVSAFCNVRNLPVRKIKPARATACARAVEPMLRGRLRLSRPKRSKRCESLAVYGILQSIYVPVLVQYSEFMCSSSAIYHSDSPRGASTGEPLSTYNTRLFQSQNAPCPARWKTGMSDVCLHQSRGTIGQGYGNCTEKFIGCRKFHRLERVLTGT